MGVFLLAWTVGMMVFAGLTIGAAGIWIFRMDQRVLGGIMIAFSVAMLALALVLMLYGHPPAMLDE